MDGSFSFFHWTNVLIIPGLLIGYTVHELAHACTAYYFGDHSQVERGKFTLNPFRHLSWFGSISFLIFGIGWPNPVEMYPPNLRRRPMSMALTALAGPLASFTFGLVAMLFTLLLAALLVMTTSTTTDTILQLIFPTGENLPETLNLQALTMAFTGKIAIASFWIAATSSLPLPSMDGFLVLVSTLSYVQHRRSQTREARPQAVPAVPGTTSPPHTIVTIINQVERRNNVSDIHFKLGAEYHQSEKFDDAIARYRQAIATDKNFGPAYVNLGLAYLAKGRRREAIHAFRGAIQFSDDQKSQQTAWYQLHQLSEVSPVDDNADEELAEIGSSPWTDTTPRPNWLSMAVSMVLLLAAGIALYSYLWMGLVRMLQT